MVTPEALADNGLAIVSVPACKGDELINELGIDLGDIALIWMDVEGHEADAAGAFGGRLRVRVETNRVDQRPQVEPLRLSLTRVRRRNRKKVLSLELVGLWAHCTGLGHVGSADVSLAVPFEVVQKSPEKEVEREE